MTDVHSAGSSDIGSAPATAAGAVHLPFSAAEIGASGLQNEFTVYEIRDACGNSVIDGICDPECAFIVRACNSHYELVAALEDIAAGLHYPNNKPSEQEAVRLARAALSKVQS